MRLALRYCFIGLVCWYFWSSMALIMSICHTVKRYVRKGIPNEYRALTWMGASGAQEQLEKNPGYYHALLTGEHDARLVEVIRTGYPEPPFAPTLTSLHLSLHLSLQHVFLSDDCLALSLAPYGQKYVHTHISDTGV